MLIPRESPRQTPPLQSEWPRLYLGLPITEGDGVTALTTLDDAPTRCRRDADAKHSASAIHEKKFTSAGEANADLLVITCTDATAATAPNGASRSETVIGILACCHFSCLQRNLAARGTDTEHDQRRRGGTSGGVGGTGCGAASAAASAPGLRPSEATPLPPSSPSSPLPSSPVAIGARGRGDSTLTPTWYPAPPRVRRAGTAGTCAPS